METTDRWERLAALSGLALVVLAVVGFALAGELPHSGGAALRDHFADNRGALLAAAYILALAAVALLWFAGSVRAYLRRAEGEPGRLADVAFGGGVAAAGLILAGSSVFGSLAWRSSETVEPALAQAVFDVGHVFLHAADFALGAFILATAVVVLRTGCLARWFGWASVLVGLFVLAVRAIPSETYGPETLGYVEFVLMMGWLAGTSIGIARRLRPGAPLPAAAPTAPV